MDKKILIAGAVGNTERQNRDNARVVLGAGIVFGLKAHISLEPPMVIKKWKK